MKNNITLVFLLSFLFMMSCSVSTDTKNQNKLYVHLQDKNKNPIENAGLHFYVDFSQGYKQNIGFHKTGSVEAKAKDSVFINYRLYQNYPNPFNPSTNIGFSISKSGSGSLRILDRLDSTLVVRTLIDGLLQAGMYTFSWDGKNDDGENVTNNIYTYQFVTDEFRDSKNLFIDMIDPGHIKSLNCIPLAASDAKGNIEVDYNIFPINEEVMWLNQEGSELGVLTVPETISLVFIKEGYLSETKTVTIVPDKPLELTVTLEKE